MLYENLVYFHIMLLVFWLGADLGVFIAGQYFRDRSLSLESRLTALKLLVATDMGPRTAWALMVPSTINLLAVGGYWDIGAGWQLLSWVIGLVWLALVWAAHVKQGTPAAASYRKIELFLKILLTAFYLWLGIQSLLVAAPLAESWLAAKALIFGIIFAFAIMIDVAFKPVGPLLGELISKGSSDEVELPLRSAMDRTRIWVLSLYVLLLVIAWFGVVKPLL